MSWIDIYNSDLSTQQKRLVKNKIIAEDIVKVSRFYEYLKGKQGRSIIIKRIEIIVNAVRENKIN
jgi:hypothetical protein